MTGLVAFPLLLAGWAGFCGIMARPDASLVTRKVPPLVRLGRRFAASVRSLHAAMAGLGSTVAQVNVAMRAFAAAQARAEAEHAARLAALSSALASAHARERRPPPAAD